MKSFKSEYSPESLETTQDFLLASWRTSVLRAECGESLGRSLACQIGKVKGARVGKMRSITVILMEEIGNKYIQTEKTSNKYLLNQ